MARETTPTEETGDELSESLWKAVAQFVKKCGGDLGTVSTEERAEFEEALAAWAVLSLSEDEE